jgi:RecA-family ATPase
MLKSVVARPAPAPAPPTKPAMDYKIIDLRKAITMPSPQIDFVIPGLKAGTAGIVGGAGGSSKTMYALQAALCVATGFDAFGFFGDAIIKRGRVVYLSLEDTSDVIEERICHITRMMRRDGNGLSDHDIDELSTHLEIIDMYGTDFTMARAVKGSVIKSESLVDLMPRLAGARLVIVDTWNRAMSGGGLDENSSADMSVAMKIVDGICRKVGCAVIAIHHLNKSGAFGEDELHQGALRGSSVIVDNARWLMILKVLGEKIATKIWNENVDEQRKSWVISTVVKQNYGKPTPEMWFSRAAEGGVLDGKVERPEPKKPTTKNVRNVIE